MNSFIKMRPFIKKSCLAIAVLLLLVNIVGIFIHPNLHTAASLQKKGIPGYNYPVIENGALLKLLTEKAPTVDSTFVDSTTKKVFYAMFHSEARRIAFYENWIMWLCGKIYRPASRTLDAKLLVKAGAGNCSERTQVLMDIFKLNGLDCRIISLNGHITLQVFFNGQWMVADADYGLVYKGDMHQMQTAGLQFADSVLSKNAFSDELRKNYLYFWKTSSDNILLPLNKESSTRLYKAEKLSQWLRWIIPALLLIICIVPYKKARQVAPGENNIN